MSLTGKGAFHCCGCGVRANALVKAWRRYLFFFFDYAEYQNGIAFVVVAEFMRKSKAFHMISNAFYCLNESIGGTMKECTCFAIEGLN
jgi:hypothetical protein